MDEPEGGERETLPHRVDSQLDAACCSILVTFHLKLGGKDHYLASIVENTLCNDNMGDRIIISLMSDTQKSMEGSNITIDTLLAYLLYEPVQLWGQYCSCPPPPIGHLVRSHTDRRGRGGKCVNDGYWGERF